MADYLLVIGDREALGWLLSEQRMAFPDTRRSEVRALAPGDGLFLYTTRGCFKNPTRDRGRVIAEGTAVGSVHTLDDPPEFGGRSYPVGCAVEFRTATAWPEGVELGPLVGRLTTFAGAEKVWSIRLRRPLLTLPRADAELLRGRLDALRPRPLPDVLPHYARWWRAGQS